MLSVIQTVITCSLHSFIQVKKALIVNQSVWSRTFIGYKNITHTHGISSLVREAIIKKSANPLVMFITEGGGGVYKFDSI